MKGVKKLAKTVSLIDFRQVLDVVVHVLIRLNIDLWPGVLTQRFAGLTHAHNKELFHMARFNHGMPLLISRSGIVSMSGWA